MLIVEEAVVLVDDLPQGFEVALRGVLILLCIYTGGEE
jgi:hypothetical protein